ncbi:MAG: ArsC/Spx/MgsR family protein [Crocinitomicaceae bacterium]|nr:ArsC/Spx/MgsR family protein [Crocinitomicaceae bacterium]
MIFANTDKEITVIYDSNEHIGRQILAYAQTENLPIHDVDLVHQKLTPTHWVGLAKRLNIEVKNLVNTDDPDFVQKFGDVSELSEDDWLKLFVHNPDILRAPIVMKGEKIVMMSNSQDMLHFLD